ncbi:hypothetical protein Pedsa_1509 [Pseudopedobacter saltans DSM 12145]|uniref:Uncharacterized protein n=1 Tax=Pseudopedobacter saltans (strain ATCC 51119 / DSM 12145 / JCM 21818 / CCUG 39354 / LMG 10337 / NBRC 100064 / NCIMB 13643) TaxID=762903 RepID=F0S5C5_PSESL|nr:hypothetical protein [Pseudopedobacter saltans]ADY52070.1 hypothetical protein Pedsa_1509 [Pseudopedobacter saltans DSM 12145]
MKDTKYQKFNISINIGDKPYKVFDLQIQPEDTTDGVPFYICETNGVEISRLRKDEKNQWEQIWGDLDTRTINNIGKAIEMHDSSRF